MKYDYDTVVIGAGSAGLTAASGLKKIGRKVLLVERAFMGGECTNSGCIPSKALIHHASSFYAAETIAGKSKKLETYQKAAFSYVRTKIESVRAAETPTHFIAKGIDVVSGEAEFIAPGSIRVNDSEYAYKIAVIATGSTPRVLAIPGIDQKDVLTNQNLFSLDNPPKKLLIVGGGPVGLEMGMALAMLGSAVTIIEVNSQFAPLEDPAIAALIEKKFIDLGVTIHCDTSVTAITNRIATIVTGPEKKEQQLAYDKILFAVGRSPNLPVGLTVAGIEANETGILVDSQYRTTNKRVYAIGDVASQLKFTHTADDIARQVVTRIASHGLLRVSNKKAVPKVTYTKPEIAQVGLSHQAALKKYSAEEIMRVEVPFSENDRATTDSSNGLLVVIARRLNGAVLGAHIVGPSTGELITLFTMAIDHKISLWSLRQLIYPYPTYSLVIKKAGDHFFAAQLTSLKADLWRLLKRGLPKLIAAGIWIIALWQFYHYQRIHNMEITDTALMTFNFITMTAWSPLVYILLYAIRPITFFPATALTILAGVFFGFWYGTILTVIAATLSACVAYSIGRWFGSSLRLEDSLLGNWVESARKNTFEAILTMRLIFLPFDGVSYAAGILKTAFFPFVTATFLGILLGTATFVSIGASLNVEEFKIDGLSLNVVNPTYIALSIGILLTSLLLSRLLKR